MNKKSFHISFTLGRNTGPAVKRHKILLCYCDQVFLPLGNNVFEDKMKHLGSKFLSPCFDLRKYLFTSCSLCWMIGFLLCLYNKFIALEFSFFFFLLFSFVFKNPQVYTEL